jgi:hypothetical protein
MCVWRNGAHVSDKWIRGITVKQTSAEATVTLSGNAVQTITSAGLAELRKKLYAMGFSKRAIATAVKDIERENA